MLIEPCDIVTAGDGDVAGVGGCPVQTEFFGGIGEEFKNIVAVVAECVAWVVYMLSRIDNVSITHNTCISASTDP